MSTQRVVFCILHYFSYIILRSQLIWTHFDYFQSIWNFTFFLVFSLFSSYFSFEATKERSFSKKPEKLKIYGFSLQHSVLSRYLFVTQQWGTFWRGLVPSFEGKSSRCKTFWRVSEHFMHSIWAKRSEKSLTNP